MILKTTQLLFCALLIAAPVAHVSPALAGPRPAAAAKPQFNAAAGARPAPVTRTGSSSVRPKSLARPSTTFNRESGARIQKIPMHVTPKGRIVPDSRVPRFNEKAGVPARIGPAPRVLTTSSGQKFTVPKGMVGPIPTRSNKGKGNPNGGVAFRNPKTGQTMRVMPPRGAIGKAPAYPHGYVVHNNAQNQTIIPSTGGTAKKSDPYKGHLPIRPR